MKHTRRIDSDTSLNKGKPLLAYQITFYFYTSSSKNVDLTVDIFSKLSENQTYMTA
jgi:hypothetical protein